MYLDTERLPNQRNNTKLASLKIAPKIRDDDSVWASRSNFWLKEASLKSRRSSARRDARQPLILTGYGVQLRVEQGTLLVRNGFTHYPQQREEFRLFPGDWRVPSRIVVLDGRGAITFDALRWLSEQNVSLVQIDWRGDVLQVAGGTGYAMDRELVEVQGAAQKNGAGFKLSQRLIAEKISNSINTLSTTLPESPTIELALRKIEVYAQRIRRHPPSSVSDLLGIEGRVAAAYFGAWVSFPLQWTGIGRHPIPDDWKRIGPRGSMAGGKSYRNRNATHPVNAMLNYAYAVLEHQIHMRIVAAGLDPTIGFFHGAYRDKPSLVYDLMEPLRPIVDRQILDFVQRTPFSPGDFTLTERGVCRLNPQLARNVVRGIEVNSAVAATIAKFARNLASS